MFDRPSCPEAKLPVAVITGFLGSGKTTFINQLLERVVDLRVAVLVNELGQIDIDSQLIRSQDKNKVELTNGCICCSINDSLMEAVLGILARRDAVDYLMVETTGVADPLPIMQSFLATELWNFTRLDAVISLVDAETFESQDPYQSQAAGRQISYADILILNKSDCVSAARLEGLTADLTALRPRIRILTATYGQVPLDLILDVHLTRREVLVQDPLAVALQGRPSSHLRDDGFTSVEFSSDRPLSLRAFQQFLEHQLPRAVIRGKGVLWFAESRDRHVFQLCGQRITLQDDAWQGPPKTELVLIGRHLDPQRLRGQLADCLAAPL
ncbi:CobW family GTP-binding protein [Lyngbya confervoides]|uniref:GTP-binding protein n=1 Tax=Lyngbya confervoides BDU141951 TaxID=1574623 RepID=A0ABD4T537_9CYAN|nr:GTP-binding protein [Lyngbya confervoides]MCM1983632.1 GTP-binding protein [Lyngbya confervoides BDU141951]